MPEDESNEMTTKSDTQVPVSNSMAAFSKQIEQLTESLDILYIKNNAGGRKIFRDKWPEVAGYVFGSELTAYDMDGVSDDDERAHRCEMEDEADMRRIDLKQTMSELVEKSVDAGSLQFEYVGSVVDKYGPLLSQFLYEENVIERVRPGILVEAKKVYEAEKEQEINEQGAVPDQIVSQEPQVSEDQAVVAPQEEAPAQGGEALPLQGGHPETAPEQSAKIEQSQDIAGTKQISEPEAAPEMLQQTEVPDFPGEPEVQQSEPVAEPLEANHVQPSVGEEGIDNDRLSSEEVELLSNKEPVLETLESVAEVSVTGGPAQEDSLEHVRPIETPMPDSKAVEAGCVQDILPEEALLVAEQAVESVVSDENQTEPFFADEIAQAPEAQAPEVQVPVTQDEAQNIEAVAQPEEALSNEELSVEQEQIHAAEAVRELLADEMQGLVAPELLNLHEAMAAQKIIGIEELLAQGILHEGDLPQRDQPEEKPEAVVEAEVKAQEQVADEIVAAPESPEKPVQEESPVLSLKEEALREDLSEALKGLSETVDTIDMVAPQPVALPVETPDILPQQEEPVVEEKTVQTGQLQPETVDIPIKQRPPEAVVDDADIPDIIKYISEQEESESSDDQKI